MPLFFKTLMLCIENPKSSSSYKWSHIISPIWHSLKPRNAIERTGIYFLPSDPDAIIKRLD